MQRDLRHRLDEGLEAVVAGDEVGLGVHLDHRRAAGRGDDAHQALGRDAAGLLRRGGEALGAQPVDRGLHVAAGLGQRALAVHHARAGLLAQVLHQGGGDLGHRSISVPPAAGQALAASAGDLDLRHGFRRQVLDRAQILARGGHLGADAVQHRARHQVAVQRDGADRVVVAGHREGHAGGIGVAVQDRDHRDVQLVRLLDRELLLVRVDDEQDVRQAAHLLDAAQRALQLVAVAGDLEHLLLGEALDVAAEHLLDLAQPLDRAGDGLPVGQRAAEPAVVDVVLAAALGGVGHVFGGGALGADEQHAPAGGGDVADGAQRAVEQRHGLLQVDDVHLVAHAIQIRPHRGVPAAGVVAEVDAGFEQLAHGEVGHRHGAGPFAVVRLCLRGGCVAAPDPPEG